MGPQGSGGQYYLLGPGAHNGEGNGNPLQYSCLENPMDGGAWWAAVHGVARSRTWLSNFTFTFHFHALEKEMAPHSSVLAWRIPGTGEPGGLPSMGSHRVGHHWSDLAAGPQNGYTILHFHQQYMSDTFSPHVASYMVVSIFWNFGHFNWCGVPAHCGYNLHFSSG